MALFKLSENNELKKINLKNFDSEKELQRLCEVNLEELFQVRFVATEFQINDGYDGRLDTIGIDYDGNPVIIEYKLEKNSYVISQTLFYMDWLVNHHADFEMAVQRKLGSDIKVSWNNPKMLIIAQEYNKYDKYAVNQIPYDIYLYKYLYYNNNELYFENINTWDNRRYINTQSENNNSDRYVQKEYDISYHLDSVNDIVKSLYKELDEKVMEINDQIEKRIRKFYVGYRTTKTFLEVHFQKNVLQIYILVEGDYGDVENRFETVPETFQWKVNKRMTIKNRDDLEYAMNIIKKSYEATL